VCDELNIPIIFDYHHDWINPSTEPPAVLIPKINELWARKGIRVKQHLSEPRPGAESVMERRAHADRCKSLPDALPDDVDLMIEAKDKASTSRAGHVREMRLISRSKQCLSCTEYSK